MVRKVSDINILRDRTHPEFICTPEEFKPFKYADYIVARTIGSGGMSVIFMLEEKHSQRNHEEWLKIVKHEIVHVFYTARLKTGNPRWLNEGLAQYLSGQKNVEHKVTLKELLKHHDQVDNDTYKIGYNAVKRILSDN